MIDFAESYKATLHEFDALPISSRVDFWRGQKSLVERLLKEAQADGQIVAEMHFQSLLDKINMRLREELE